MDDAPSTVPSDLVGRAVDALDHRLYVLDPEGHVRYVNEPAAAAMEQRPADQSSVHITDCFPAAHADQIEATLRTARIEGDGSTELHLDADRADGDVAHEFSTRTLADEEGEHVGFVATCRDVSERKGRERLLTELHRTTRELMAAESPEAAAETTVGALSNQLALHHTGIHLLDEDEDRLVPVAWTEAVEATLGEPPALGPDSLAWRAFESGEVGHHSNLDDIETHNPETVLRSELIIPLGDHGVALVASTEPAAFDGDDRRFAQMLCANLTAALDRHGHAETLRRRERELERENERLDEFAGVVSHDLRTPLNVAQGRLELLREECDSDHVGPAERALERMETLIEDLLTLARDGKRVDDPERVDLESVVEGARANAATDDDAVVQVADDATVLADESRLTQAFENLIRNSVEHGSTSNRTQSDNSVEHGSTGSRAGPDDSVEHGSTDESPVTITVGTLPDGFYVEDDGPGIPPEDRDRVLEVGYSTTDDGTGFGLSIVRDVVNAHGWEITVTEGADGGARFEIAGVTFA